MELFSSAWASALLSIVLIDLVLAGDNAIVIALAARKLLPHLQKRAIVWGSTLVLRLVERIPAITYAGAGVLAYTAAQMIVNEPLLDAVFERSALSRIMTHALLIAGVLVAGWWAARRHRHASSSVA